MKGAVRFSLFWTILALLFFAGSFFLVPPGELTMISPAGYPLFISALCLGFSVLVLVKTRREGRKGQAAGGAGSEPEEQTAGGHGSEPESQAAGGHGREPEAGPGKQVFDPVVVRLMILLVLYVAAIPVVHYTAATLMFLLAALCYLRKGRWKNALMISYISTFMILLVFKYLFSVILP